MLYRVSRSIARILFSLYFRVQVLGQEHIPDEGPCLIVANHASFLDPLLICTTCPRVIHYITYARFYYHPLLHWFCQRTYCLPVKKAGNDISALKQALRLLRSGECVGIFPEGVRSLDGKLQRGEPGTALIALRAKTPILPVGIQGTYEAFPRGAICPKPRTPIRLQYGTPFFIHDHLEVDKNRTDELQEKTTDVIMSNIAELCGQEAVFLQKT